MADVIRISSSFCQGRVGAVIRPGLTVISAAHAARRGRRNRKSVHVRMWLRLIHIFVFCGLTVLCGVWGCSDRRETTAEEQVVIRVDDRVLTLTQFNEFFETINSSYESGGIEGATAVREARLGFLLQLLEEMIVLRRADELDLKVTPEELDQAVVEFKKDYPETAFEDLFFRQAIPFEAWKERLRRRLLVEKVIQADVLKTDADTPEEIKEYYENHRDEWSRGDEIRVRHILLSEEEQAESILKQLQSGADFAELARLHSTAPEALQGGDMGYIARGQLPASLEEPLFSLKPGEVSPIIKTSYGFHIFHVVEKRETSVPRLEDCIERIREEMKKERLAAAYGPWLAKLRSRYQIKIDKEII